MNSDAKETGMQEDLKAGLWLYKQLVQKLKNKTIVSNQYTLFYSSRLNLLIVGTNANKWTLLEENSRSQRDRTSNFWIDGL